MKRRTVLKGGLAALALAGTATSAGLLKAVFAEPMPLPLKMQSVIASNALWRRTPAFAGTLPIPPLLEDLDPRRNVSRFSMDVQHGRMEFFPGTATSTMGYNGNFLGPTIRVRRGQRFRIDVNNRLSQTTSLHWHGLHVPARWDGGPRQPIRSGTTWSPEFTINQEAATLWYHPHAMGLTGEQVYHGLAGFFLIEDEVSDSLDIPKIYGVDDIPLVIQDRRFLADGQFSYVQNSDDVVHGVIGNHMLVNGARQPDMAVPRGMVRLRVLNGSNSSIYTVSFRDRRSFQVIASDGGFLERPAAVRSVVLSAGERVEILVDYSGSAIGHQASLMVDQLGGDSFEAMKITVDRDSRSRPSSPAYLRSPDRIPFSEATGVRGFTMATMAMGNGGRGMGMTDRRLTINGRKMDVRRIDERVRLGSTEIWEITNQRSSMGNDMPHSMHLHDVQFQILSRNGRALAPHEQGRKDTVLILPGETVRVISRFRDYTGVYMYHCHLLEHEDDGMMGQFEVVG